MPEGGISKQYRQNRLQLPMPEGDISKQYRQNRLQLPMSEGGISKQYRQNRLHLPMSEGGISKQHRQNRLQLPMPEGDIFYFGYDIYKLLTCRRDGIARFIIVMIYIQRLFLAIYDCSNLVSNLRPKNVVYRKSVSFVKGS